MDGIYSITFRGAFDWGIGMLMLHKEVITGVDAGGVNYDGQFQEFGDSVKFDIVMTVPPGATLVQGTPAKSEAYKISFQETVPRSDIENNQTVRFNQPPGPVNVIFSKLRELS